MSDDKPLKDYEYNIPNEIKTDKINLTREEEVGSFREKSFEYQLENLTESQLISRFAARKLQEEEHQYLLELLHTKNRFRIAIGMLLTVVAILVAVAFGGSKLGELKGVLENIASGLLGAFSVYAGMSSKK